MAVRKIQPFPLIDSWRFLPSMRRRKLISPAEHVKIHQESQYVVNFRRPSIMFVVGASGIAFTLQLRTSIMFEVDICQELSKTGLILWSQNLGVRKVAAGKFKNRRQLLTDASSRSRWQRILDILRLNRIMCHHMVANVLAILRNCLEMTFGHTMTTTEYEKSFRDAIA